MCKPRMVHVCTYHPPIHFIALTAIPVLSPVLFMPSLYYTSYNSKNFLFTILYSYASLLMPHCPVTVVQRYRDGVCSLLFHLFFIICHPLHLEEMVFILVYLPLSLSLRNPHQVSSFSHSGSSYRGALNSCSVATIRVDLA